MSVRRIADRSFGRGHTLPAATGPAGTAHGPAIDLKPRAGAATGGYLVIDQPQANAIMDEMERENAINPITLERPELRASVFRTVARIPKENGDPRYSYWDPAELWRWLQQPNSQGRMPGTNEPVWFEDWWALYYTYGAPAVPSWAYSLEKRNPDTQPSASVRGAAPGVPPAQRRNAVRDRSFTITPDEARAHDANARARAFLARSHARVEREREELANVMTHNIPSSDGRMQAVSNRDPGNPTARAAAVARARAEGIIRRRPRQLGRGLFREEGRMETQEEADARAEREEADEERRVQEWEAWQRDLSQYQRTPEEEEAFHLAEAERYRNAPPNSAFGDSNEQQEQYHRNQAAMAAARRANNTPPNPFGSPNPFGAP